MNFLKKNEPFVFPYWWKSFDITGDDCTDLDRRIAEYVVDNRNWRQVDKHQSHIAEWEQNRREEIAAVKSPRKRRKLIRQLDALIDNSDEYNFSGFRMYHDIDTDFYHDEEELTVGKSYDELKNLRAWYLNNHKQ